jgi:hypothetical protein
VPVRAGARRATLQVMAPRFLPLSLLVLAACAADAKTTDSKVGEAKATEPALAEPEVTAFDLEVKNWEGPTGEEGQVIVTVKARSGFHINDKYPHKVKLDDPPDGLTLPVREMGKENAQLDGEQALTYTIPATPTKAGEYKLTGVVKLSVCSEEQCKIAKEQLDARVTAQ